MSPKWYCVNCGFQSELWSNYYWKCPRCGKPLSIKYDIQFNPKGAGLKRYESLLPFTPDKTRGEGQTPIVIDENGRHTLVFKLEYLNPSGSFKDRGSALALYYGYKMGYKEVVEDTSGNTGISVTLYAKLYGMKPYIFMPKKSPSGKKLLVKLLGGEVVEAKDRSDASQKVLNYIDKRFYVAHTWSYFYVLGASTISYEVYERHGIPDYVISPIGSGGILLGLIRGFETLYELGVVNKIPGFIGVQGYSVQPVFKNMYGYEKEGESSDLADGIMVVNPPRLHEILEYLRKYKGEIVLVGNTEIKSALKELYEQGFIVEPTSATVWAAYKKIRDNLSKGSVLLPLTGSGLKMLDLLRNIIK